MQKIAILSIWPFATFGAHPTIDYSNGSNEISVFQPNEYDFKGLEDRYGSSIVFCLEENNMERMQNTEKGFTRS